MELSLVNASIRRDDFLLSDLSLTLKEGLTAITGKSGSGKTTILTMLSGLLPLRSGSLLLSGKEVSGQVPGCGVIFQFPERQLFSENVFSDVAFSLRHSGLGKSDVKDKAAAALSIMGIDEAKWYESPFSLSGGERRRAAIAGVIVSDPRVVLADEPTVGLDGHSYDIVMRFFSEFRDSGRIVAAVTHDPDLTAMSDRVILIDNGQIAGDGLPDDLVSSGISELSLSLGLGRTVSFDILVDRIASMLGGRR